MEKQKGSRNIREPFTIKYGFFMRALCAFGKSSIKLGLLIISGHKNYCLKGDLIKAGIGSFLLIY